MPHGGMFGRATGGASLNSGMVVCMVACMVVDFDIGHRAMTSMTAMIAIIGLGLGLGRCGMRIMFLGLGGQSAMPHRRMFCGASGCGCGCLRLLCPMAAMRLMRCVIVRAMALMLALMRAVILGLWRQGAMTHGRMFGGATGGAGRRLCAMVHMCAMPIMSRTMALRGNRHGKGQHRNSTHQGQRQIFHASSPFGRTLTTRIIPACI